MHGQVAPDWSGRPMFEQLEPRLLLSADFSSVALPDVLSAPADSVPVLAKPLEAPASWSADYDAGGAKGDAYEENDTRATAYDLSAHEQTWLSTISGPGVQADDDWYEIYVSPGDENLVVDLTFSHAAGDIDLDVYDSGGVLVADSYSTTDDEHIDTILPGPGTYYLLVYYGNAGNAYDLWWDDIQPQVQDDAYEENDTQGTAYDLSAHEQTWLSSINGPGVQADDDWYEIYITPGDENLLVDLTFTHAAGDIDLEVYDSGASLVADSYSTTDDEHIDTILPGPGTYYLLVYYGDAWNTYDLWWDDVPPQVQDDAYEENDTRATAYDLSGYEQTWLSSISGPGVQADDDWYEIYITPGDENLVVDLTFTHAAGNIDLDVYDSGGSLVMDSSSTTDNEHIDTILPSPGTYYLRVYYGDAWNTYDLWWDDVLQLVQDDAYEENDTQATAYDLSAYEQISLSTITGPGVQADDDWYEIFVSPGEENLIVDLTFTHAAGNIDLDVYDSGGVLVAYSYSTTDDEHIDTVLPSSGTYHLLVYWGNAGNTYDLRWDDVPLQVQDDAYEENDTQGTAYDLSAHEQTWLNTISGPGVQADDDWYEIFVSPGDENLIVDLTFSDEAGNINLEVYDSGGVLVANSYSVTDDEHIDTILPGPGTYYLLVYHGDAWNSYDLWWNDFQPQVQDDEYEENDTRTTAFDLSSHEQTWLSTISGPGVQADDDWYEIDVTSGEETLIVDLTFTHAAGNIDLEVYDSGGVLVANSYSTTDDEHIDTVLPAPGTYYLLVHWGNAGNSYDLRWDDSSFGPGPDPGDGIVTYRALLVDSWGLSNEDIYGLRDALLASVGGEWVGNITLIEYADATVNNVQAGISALASASDQDDLALIHFTSPGLQIGLDGVPLDEPDADDGEIAMIDGGILDDELGLWCSAFAAGPYPMERFVLIVNSNNSGEFVDGTADPAGTVPSHVILASSQADEASYAGVPYTEFAGPLIDALSNSAALADYDYDGYISAEEAFAWAAPRSLGQAPEISDTFPGNLNLVSYVPPWWVWPSAPFEGSEYEGTIYVNQDGDATLTGGALSPAEDFDGYRVYWDESGTAVVATTGFTNTAMGYYDGPGQPDRWDDNSGVGWNARITTSVPFNQELWFAVLGRSSWTTGPYGLSVNGPAHADTAAIWIDWSNFGLASGNIFDTWDYDFYSFTTTLMGDWTVTVDPGASFDPTFNVYDSSGNPVGGSFTSPIDSVGGGGNETWTGVGLTAGATYYLRVDGESSHTGDFDIRVYGPGPSPGPGDGVVTHRALLVDSYGLNDDAYGVRDALLASTGGEWVGNITLIEYADATVYNAQSGISDLVSASDQDDLALIYFTTHGGQTGGDSSRIDEPDANDGDVAMIDGSILDDLLGSWFSRFAAGLYPLDRFVFVIDSCSSGEFLDGTADPAGTVPSHVILTASQADEVSYGGTPYSEFTAPFIYALTTDAASADLNADGYVSAEEAFTWADPRSSGQDPEISDTFPGDLNLVRYGPPWPVWPSAPFDGSEYEDTVYVNQNGDATLTGGSVSPAEDFDGYRLYWDESGTAVVETTGSTDTRMGYYDGPGTPDLTNDDGGLGVNARITTSVPVSRELWFGVLGNSSSTTGPYGLSVDGPAYVGTVGISIGGSNYGSASGNIFGTWDYDFYSFTTTVAGDWTVTVNPGASFDPTFNVYDSSGNPVGGSFTSPINSVGSGANETWTGVGLTAGATYYIRVEGLSSQTGDFDIYVQGEDTVPPNDPTGLVMTARTDQTIELSWTAPTQASDGDYAVSYIVEREGVPVGWPVGPTFTDTGLTQATPYSYDVYAVDDAGNPSLGAAVGAFSTTYPGDANTDGCVDGLDYVIWSNNYNMLGGWPEANFNDDAIVDGLDYVSWSNNYGNGCPPGVPSALTKSGELPATAELQATAALPASAAQQTPDVSVVWLPRVVLPMPQVSRVEGTPAAADWVAPAAARGPARSAHPAGSAEQAAPVLPPGTAAWRDSAPSLADLEDDLVDVLSLALLKAPLQG